MVHLINGQSETYHKKPQNQRLQHCKTIKIIDRNNYITAT